MLRFRLISTILCLFIFLTSQVQASDEQLFGNLGGLRTTLDDSGITLEAVLTHDLVYNTRGGLDKDGTILGNFDLTLEVDTETANWWKNGTLFMYVLGNYNAGGFLTDIVGDAQATSNIEADTALRLYELWYEHRFNAERVSLLVGLHDYNSEFDALEYGGLFLNSSFGISPDISQMGPSIFPVAALAARVRLQPCEQGYILAAVYDGIPGDPDNVSRTSVKLSHDDGIFAALEIGATEGEPNQSNYYKLAIGGWYHSAESESYTGDKIDSNGGGYLIAEKMLFSEGDSGQGLGGFIQLGFADNDKNQIDRYWGAGLHYTGLLTNRDSDIMGIAVACARNGDNFLRYNKNVEGVSLNHSETTIEWSYRVQVLPWLVLQPDVQYVMNPGMDPEVDNALIAGMRVEINL